MLVMIVAMNQHRTIGLHGSMPWRNKEDLKHFRETTMGHTLVMGRKTVEGLPKSLDGRLIKTVSRTLNLENTIHDLEQFCKDNENTEEIIYIAGGGEIYTLCLPYVKRILVSMIHDNDCIGDTFFPEIPTPFQEISSENLGTFTLKVFEKEEQVQ